MKRKAPHKDTSNDAEPSNINATKQPKASMPDYGSKEYWEARYKSNLLPANTHDDINAATNADAAEQGTRVVDGVELSTEVQAGHAWYFSYEELRPLILRLVVDCNDDKEEIEVDDYLSDDGSDGWEEVDDDEAVEGEEMNSEPEEEDEEPDAQSDLEAQETDSTDGDGIDPLEAYLRQSTSLSQPKTVLEIGCGDVPLGSSLTSELNSLQCSTGCNARNIVRSVECVDYSEIVIDELKKQQQEQIQSHHTEVDSTNQSKEQCSLIYPKYTASDARQLPHASNSMSIILEKGTLDAMLSHPTEGVTNSIAIVKEMARVCKVGGAILIVSHLNARTEKGMGWVSDILLVGLKEEWMERKRIQKQQFDNRSDLDVDILWSIEVHGGEEANDEDHSEDGEEQESPHGPAVYILKKKGVASSIFRQIMEKKKKKNGDDNEDSPPVKLEFLSYS